MEYDSSVICEWVFNLATGQALLAICEPEFEGDSPTNMTPSQGMLCTINKIRIMLESYNVRHIKNLILDSQMKVWVIGYV